MTTAEHTPPCDTCDGKLTKVNTAGDADGRSRFLAAYRLDPVIARAARLAGVHRATAHRWLADSAFATAARAAADDFFRRVRVEALAAETERRRWRAERERARLPMRCHYLALARAAKRVRR